MPVPSSFNDITVNETVRNWLGWVIYQSAFHAPFFDPDTQSVYLHFGSVHYRCHVYVNDRYIGGHVGGHLPFSTKIPKELLQRHNANSITVLVNNELSPTTIPQAIVSKPLNSSSHVYPSNYTEVRNTFDFFNYAGIHRSVNLYVIPKLHVQKVKWQVSIEDREEEQRMASRPMHLLSSESDTATFNLNYVIKYGPTHSNQSVRCALNLIDENQNIVEFFDKCSSANVKLKARVWQPKVLSAKTPYLYTVKIQLLDEANRLLDEYSFNTGFRSVRSTDDELLINARPVYLTGFGRHEDSPIQGRGLNAVFNVHDHNLLEWVGANCYRTSHYPYSEQLMQLADKQGILIINELPAVSIDGFSSQLLALHLQLLKELVTRDGHRPSTIMWSIANEPVSNHPKADAYFKSVAGRARSLDSTRPITAALAQPFDVDSAAPHLDVIMINRYFAWYSDPAHLDLIQLQMVTDVNRWRNKYRRPVLISEYGADTVSGAHSLQPRVFSEEFQNAYLQIHFDVFDILRHDKQLVGEMIWNFADFMTDSGITRVMGNRKGVFSRDRQPKSAVYLVRCRYQRIRSQSQQIENKMGHDGSFGSIYDYCRDFHYAQQIESIYD